MYEADVTQLPIIWQRLVSADGKTCQRCDATYQHLQSAVAKLRDVLKPLNIEPILEFREIDERSFRNKPAESNRIWIAGKPVEEWLAASVGSSWKQPLLFGLRRHALSHNGIGRSRLRGHSRGGHLEGSAHGGLRVDWAGSLRGLANGKIPH